MRPTAHLRKRRLSLASNFAFPRPSSTSPSADMLSSQLSEDTLCEMASGENNLVVEGRNPERRASSRSPAKARSLSDGGPPTLSPSPKFREPEKLQSNDDSAISESPKTPRRPAFPMRGLALQMPPRDLMSPSSSAYINRAPLSPKLDRSQTYGSPTSVLPRRSRGLDFSRAATNLHHSTLAEQSSPDSSPTITGRAMNIPNRKNGLHFSHNPESMNNSSSSLWSTMANARPYDCVEFFGEREHDRVGFIWKQFRRRRLDGRR